MFTPNYHDGVIKSLINDIPEADFDVSRGGQVEIIGWLYQYYNTEPKDIAISSPKSHKFRNIEIASVTQIFTPDWIVKYMVENSLGKLWITHLLLAGDKHSESELASKFGWTYYMPDAQQTDTTLVELDILNKSLEKISPLDIKLIDPAMGSGHILVYAFEILMNIYESEGYSKRNATDEIIKNNIYGLDIDTRAFQLSYFAILMKARQYNRRALTKAYQLNIFNVSSSKIFNSDEFDVLYSQLSPKTAKQLSELIFKFKAGDQLGSLIKVKDTDFDLITKELDTLNQNQLSFELIPLIQFAENILKISHLLAQKYHLVVANPPYMGLSRMSSVLSKYAKVNFPESKADLFSMFIQRWNEALQVGGYNAMVTMQSWMFLSSFEKMRQHILENYTISNLMHMENNVMGIAFGTAVSIFRNIKLTFFRGTYHQIKTRDAVGKSPEELPVPGNRYNRTNQANFEKIPGSPIAYWASDNVIKLFGTNTLDAHFLGKEGLGTSNNTKFLRHWYELNLNPIFSGWYPYQKGGPYRKWFGNNDYYVNWKNDGVEMKESPKSNIRNLPYQNRIGITWSAISSGKPSFRYTITPYFFDSKGPMMFHIKDEPYFEVLAYLNSKVSEFLLSFLSPTLDYRLGQIQKLPYFFVKKTEPVQFIAEECIDLTVIDWNDFEQSANYHFHPLLAHIADDNLLIWYYSLVHTNLSAKNVPIFQLWGLK